MRNLRAAGIFRTFAVAGAITILLGTPSAHAWTDNTLTADSTTIKKAHIDEVRNTGGGGVNIDSVRSNYGFGAYSYTSGVNSITADSTMIRGAHITELRAAIQEVDTAYPTCINSNSWAESITNDSTLIKRSHINELRNAVDPDTPGAGEYADDNLPQNCGTCCTGTCKTGTCNGSSGCGMTGTGIEGTGTSSCSTCCNGSGSANTNCNSSQTPPGCDDTTDDTCTNPDTCNGSGGCNGNHAAGGTDCGLCTVCNSSGSCSNADTDDSGCGTISCAGWYQMGGSNNRVCYNSANITSGRCEGAGDCKDLNSSDCNGQGTSSSQYTCGTCKKYSSGGCSGTTLGNCSANQTTSEDIFDDCSPDECWTGNCNNAGGCGYSNGGTSCGSSSNTDCDNADTCNGSGTCNNNYENAGVQFGACTGNFNNGCSYNACGGTGSCTFFNYGSGTGCSDGNGCTTGETCNGFGSCGGSSNVENCTEGSASWSGYACAGDCAYRTKQPPCSGCSGGSSCSGTPTCCPGAYSPDGGCNYQGPNGANTACQYNEGTVCTTACNGNQPGTGCSGGSCTWGTSCTSQCNGNQPGTGCSGGSCTWGTACGGCQQCVNGSCANVSTGQDPNNACTAGSSDCSNSTGYCDGNGACQMIEYGYQVDNCNYYDPGNCEAYVCDGSGGCMQIGTEGCCAYEYGCDGTVGGCNIYEPGYCQ